LFDHICEIQNSQDFTFLDSRVRQLCFKLEYLLYIYIKKLSLET